METYITDIIRKYQKSKYTDKMRIYIEGNYVYVKVPIKDVVSLREYYIIRDMLYGLGDISSTVLFDELVIVESINLRLPISLSNIKGIELLIVDLYNHIKKLINEVRYGRK